MQACWWASSLSPNHPHAPTLAIQQPPYDFLTRTFPAHWLHTHTHIFIYIGVLVGVISRRILIENLRHLNGAKKSAPWRVRMYHSSVFVCVFVCECVCGCACKSAFDEEEGVWPCIACL